MELLLPSLTCFLYEQKSMKNKLITFVWLSLRGQTEFEFMTFFIAAEKFFFDWKLVVVKDCMLLSSYIYHWNETKLIQIMYGLNI